MAVEKVALSRRKASAGLGRCSARLVRGDKAEGRDGRVLAGVASINAGTVCSTNVWWRRWRWVARSKRVGLVIASEANSLANRAKDRR